MEFLKLYDEENRDILFNMSWLNKNFNFDKSTGRFENIDLFTFLENINSFNYEKDTIYDDIYFILEYAHDSIIHLINNINKEIKREHKIVPIPQAKELDQKTILWLSRQDGRTVKEKLKNNKIKAVKRYSNVDTYENRILKIFLKKLVLIEEKRVQIQSNDKLINKIRRWLRSDDAKNINEYGNIVYNNILLHHPHYSKIFKSYRWLNRLDEKVSTYSTTFIKQLKTIIKFELLTQLQFFTKEAKVLPSTLDKDSLDNFDININKTLLDIDLENYISQIKDDALRKKRFFKSIKNFAKWSIENKIKIKNEENRVFEIKTENTSQVFIDFFRLFPIAKIDNEFTNFPITIFQNIDNSIVNANNTKVINLSHEIYTLPEILKTYNSNILRFFLEYFEKYLKDKQLNYIIPDYVNVFKLTPIKKTINSYFPKSRNIPKSILAGLKYLFEGNIQDGDTLIYIQKNHDNDLYVTPLVIKYDKALKNITNGLYLEKYPTKKLEEESDIIDELNRNFNDYELSEKLLSKFLQNGIKGIKDQEIGFYKDKELIYLINSKSFSKPKNRINTIKSLFTNKNLFKKEYIEIEDTNEENLSNFEKLLTYEQDGYNLWKEHLPRLAMGDMPINGYFGEFVLVDDDSKVINGFIEIKNHFIIPANTNELSFPLIFGEDKINFEAYITSSQLPFKEDVECKLELKYNYEDETPYKLTFIPLITKYKPLNVKWREIKYNKCNELPFPSYPEKKSWSSFKEFISKKDNNKVDLLKWFSDDLRRIIDISEFKNNNSQNIIYIEDIYFDWFKDKKGFMAAKVIISGIGEVFFHQNNFVKFDRNINSLTFELEKASKGGYQAKNICAGKEIHSIISALAKSYRFPLHTIFNNGNSLSDLDVEDEFRQLFYQATKSALYIYLNDDNIKLKDEMFYFLSRLHSNTPQEISNILVEYSNEYSTFSKYLDNLAYSIGKLELKWQQIIFDNAMQYLNSSDEEMYSDALKFIGIAIWRYDMLLTKISNNMMDLIVQKLYNSLKLKLQEKRIYFISKQDNSVIIKKSILIRLELLLALIRFRDIKNDFLHPKEKTTLNYVNLVDNISKKVISNNIKIISIVQLDIDKPESFSKTHDLLYALRVYLTADTNAANGIKILGVSDD